VDARALHIEDAGEGPVVVLAHGFGGSARNFGPQIRALRSRWRVVTYDAGGHARSAGATTSGPDPTLETLVDDMRAVMDRTRAVEPVVAGGLSLGAATALALALQSPERVRGLVLMSPPPARDRPGSLGRIATEFARVLEEEGLEAAGAHFVWGPEAGLDERGAALVRQGFLEHDPRALAGILRGVIASLPSPDDMETALSALALPVLLVSGEADPGSRETAEALAARLPYADHRVVPEAGHVVNLAAPSTVGRLLVDWLDRLPRGRGIPSRS
jgi:pimeloyl-ACP methyl ester carboxylesterase